MASFHAVYGDAARCDESEIKVRQATRIILSVSGANKFHLDATRTH
jgi:hypothetical protein